ncbi:cryptochrome/photolyase family protein [Aquirhabdus parva]|uniref:Deoxyribodipyrimidine photo-lyase n=1 Tax=Aquirhabdus parva TaxID=2283318 RepID=A0A345P5F9_9GAMM|nr:deoxyribodipyrimidine photo-lyase [Aquirhabdus parva]AXI02518.1 deoxyribodipyrimidine photo-lyase [Aquirhabdus parva]
MRRALFWFRRDLRLEDNCALYHCLKENDQVIPIFIFDQEILSGLPKQDKRVEFIWYCVQNIKKQLNEQGSDLVVNYGTALDVVELAKRFNVNAVYCNEDYEPSSINRDDNIKSALGQLKIAFYSYKDTVIFAKKEILTQQDEPYHVYTHYKNAWRKRLESADYLSYPSLKLLGNFERLDPAPMRALDHFGFVEAGIADAKISKATRHAEFLFEQFKAHKILLYKNDREFPSLNGTSFLSVHLRFGTISIRKIVRDVVRLSQALTGDQKESCEVWLNELIWRDFYFQILFNYPHVVTLPFKKQYIDFPWGDNPAGFEAWCNGQTGYPLVDAAMMQLNTLGFMHNRLRMVTASFLIKLMLIDYRLGERYFALKLLDFDLSANNGGWQWSASTGCDAQPFFRIFNPMTQSQKFDPMGIFIKKYLPVFADVPAKFLHAPWQYQAELLHYGIELGRDYPLPIVDYVHARKHALAVFEHFMMVKKSR